MLGNVCLFIGSDQDWSQGPPTYETVIYQWATSPDQNSLYMKENIEGLQSHQLQTGLCHQKSMQEEAKGGVKHEKEVVVLVRNGRYPNSLT